MASKKKIKIQRVDPERAREINEREQRAMEARIANGQGPTVKLSERRTSSSKSKSSSTKTTKSSAKSTKSSSKSTKSSAKSTKSSSKSKKSTSSKKSTQNKKPSTLMQIPRMEADRKMQSSTAATPTLRRMERNSNEWAGLHTLEQALQKQPQKYEAQLSQIEERKRELADENKRMGEAQGYTRDAQGVWRMPGTTVTGQDKSASQTLLEGMLTPASVRLMQRAGGTEQPAYTPQSLPNASVQEMARELRQTQDKARTEAVQQWARERGPIRATDRIESTLDSIVGRAASAVPALVETSRQQARNVQRDQGNARLQQLQAEADNLRAYLTTVSMEAGGEDYQQKYARYLDLLDEIEQADTDTPVNPTLPGQTRARQSARSAEEATRGLRGAGKVVGDALVGAANTAATLAATGGNPWAAGAVMGLEAAAGKATELNARGIAPGEALGRGLVSGGIELLTEKVPAERLMDVVRQGGRSLLRNALAQAGVEATEEGVSYLANAVADAAAQDPEAEISLQDLAQNMAMGAISGGVLGGAGTGVNRLASRYRTAQTMQAAPQTAVQNAQALPAAYQAEVADPDSAVVDSASLSPGQEARSTEPMRAGQATVIYSPYSGKTPSNTGTSLGSRPVVQISQDAVQQAQDTIRQAAQTSHFKSFIKGKLQQVFQGAGGQRQVALQNVTLDGKPYIVQLNPNIAGKIASDKNITPEKLAVFENLDTAIQSAEYVGSGNYNKNKTKSSNVIRYDYFEEPLSIHGQDFVMTFDVEVYQDRNNFRTYRVINKIDLVPVNAVHQSLSGSGVQQAPSPSITSIAQQAAQSNPAEHISVPAAGGTAVQTPAQQAVQAAQNEQFTQAIRQAEQMQAEQRAQAQTDAAYQAEVEDPDSAVVGVERRATSPEIRTLRNEDYEMLGSLSEDAVRLGNLLAETGNPVQALQEMQSAYETAYARALQSAADYIGSYRPQGVDILQDEYGNGYRASRNEPWYSEFYRKNGHGPRKQDIPALAEQLVQQDRNGSMFGFTRTAYNRLAVLRELQSRVINREGFTGIVTDAQGDAQALYDMQPQDIGRVDAAESVGAAPSGFDPYTALTGQYGILPEGENPARYAYVPQSTNGQDRVRRFWRTAVEAEATPDTMIQDFEDAVVRGEASYDPRKNKDDLQKAVRYLENVGLDTALRTWESKMQSGGEVTADDLIAAQILYKEAAKAGDTQTAMRLLGQMAAEYTKAGQAVQSARLLKRATPEGKFAFIQRSVQNLQDDLNRKRGDKAPQITLDETLAQNLMNAQDQAGMDMASEALYRDIARQIPGTWADKANAWRYLAMLGNPRTHIRNLTGNVVFALPVGVKNKMGAALEKAFVPAGQRTKTLTRADRATRDFAKADAQEMMDVLKGGGKYNPSDIIREYQDPFSPEWLLGRALNKASRANSDALDAEDSIFLGYHYRNALAGYMKANNLRPEQMKNELGAATPELEKARTYAIGEAQKATFRDASALANALARFEDTNAASRLLVGGFVPFKKTPINILKRGVEYSPAGIIKGLKEAAVDLRRGTKTPAQVIDSFSAGLTGTALMALGAFLAKEGFLTGADEEERKEQFLNDAEGLQSYALNLGDFTYTVDWSAPASLPLFMGVELWNAVNGMEDEQTGATGVKKLDAFAKALQNITEPVFNLTMMDGVQGAIQGAAYSDGNAVSSALGSMVSDYFGQFVPTLLGQAARTVDDTRRTTYAGKTITGIESVDTWLQRQQNKIPGLSQRNIPYMDVFGNTDTEPNAALRAFENFVSPGYISRRQDDPAVTGLRDLYRQTGDGAALPNKAQSSFNVNGQKVELSQQDYAAYVQSRGQVIQEGLRQMFASDAYQNLSDADKVEAVQKLYDYATAEAKAGVSDYEPSASHGLAASSGVEPGVYYGYKQQMTALQDRQDPEYREKTAQQILADTSLSDESKNALLVNLIVPAFGQTENGVNSAQEEWQSYQDLMTPEEYIRARQAYAEIGQQFEGQDNAAGKRQGAWVTYLDQAGLSDAARTQLEADRKFYSMFPATPESTSFSMLSRYGGKNEKSYASAMESSGLSIEQYYAAKAYKSSLSGSGQKERVIQWMRDQGWSGAQISAAGSAMGYKMSGLQLP